MIASPLSHWQWAAQTTRPVDTRVRVSALFSEWQSHLQRNLTQLISNDSALYQDRPTPGALQQIGESRMYHHIKNCVSKKYRSRQVITAIRTADHGLELASWRVSADGAVIQTGTSGTQSDRVAQLDMARAHKFVVAYRSLTQQLVLVSWSISNTGAIYRAGEHHAEAAPIRSVKIAALSEDLLVTACLTQNRQLRLTSWRLEEDASFTPLAQQEVVSEHLRDLALVQLTPQGDEARFALIARTETKQLRLQLWRVTAAGHLQLWSAQQLTSEATHFQAVGTEQGGLILALRNRNGNLRLLSWQLNNTAAGLQLSADSGEMDLAVRRFELMSEGNQLIGVLTTQDRRVRLRRWLLGPAGEITLQDEATSPLNAVGPVMLCSELLAGNAPLLAGMFTAAGTYQLTTWAL